MLQRLIRGAASLHPLPVACLERSIVLRQMLRRRGVEAELKIGVRREGEKVRAHAWLEHDGRPVGEPEEVEERFATLKEWKDAK